MITSILDEMKMKLNFQMKGLTPKMGLICKYIDHGRNGLYITESTTMPIKKVDPELILEIDVSSSNQQEIMCGIQEFSEIRFDESSDQKKKIHVGFVNITKQLCEDNLFIHFNSLRHITLTKFFQPRFRFDFWNVEDKIELFLKVCERMYNKSDYNFVISIKRQDGTEKIRTFRDNGYLDYISRIDRNTYFQVTIDNVKVYNPEEWVTKVEEMYYAVENFAERLNTMIEGFLATPGLLFKKLNSGIPFGLWLVSQFIDTGDDHIEKIMITKQKLGKMFFENDLIFSGEN